MTHLPMIANDYAPYNTLKAFSIGYTDYRNGTHTAFTGVDQQAYDRGMDCAMKVARWSADNVGSN